MQNASEAIECLRMDTVIGIIPIIIPVVLFYKKVNIFTYFDIPCILETIFYYLEKVA